MMTMKHHIFYSHMGVYASSMLQDKIYRKFVKDICNNNLSTLTDIKKIADYMNKHIVKHDKNRWYA